MRKRQQEELLRVRKIHESSACPQAAISSSQYALDADVQTSEFAHDVPIAEDPIFDSGASRNLIAKKLVEDFPQFIHTTDQVMTLSMASGPVDCAENFRYLSPQAEECVVALVLPDTPTVLSMGVFVIDLGWHFEWPALSFAPFAIRPDGVVVWFVVRDYAVFLQNRAIVVATLLCPRLLQPLRGG